MFGRLFVEKASKLKLDLAYERAQKEIAKVQKRKKLTSL
jgi:hypothetical protein